MATPPIVLGLDSASTTGWGLVQGERLLLHGAVDVRDRRRMDTLAALVCAKHRPDLVLIEDNYFGKSVTTLKLLARIVGGWEAVYAVRGVDTRLVFPVTWQSAILTNLMPPKADRDERKAASVKWVRHTFGITVGGDAADGIAIATYGARILNVEERVRRVTGALPRTAV